MKDVAQQARDTGADRIQSQTFDSFLLRYDDLVRRAFDAKPVPAKGNKPSSVPLEHTKSRRNGLSDQGHLRKEHFACYTISPVGLRQVVVTRLKDRLFDNSKLLTVNYRKVKG